MELILYFRKPVWQEGDYDVKRGAQKLNVSVSEFEKMMEEYLRNVIEVKDC